MRCEFAALVERMKTQYSNDPIVASSVQVDDIVYIVDIIDTEDQKQ